MNTLEGNCVRYLMIRKCKIRSKLSCKYFIIVSHISYTFNDI